MSDDQNELPFVDDATPCNYADCPDASVYHDIAFSDYASWRAINSNVVRWGLKTPAHFDAALKGLIAGDDTKDRKLGRAAHCFVLERDLFESRYVVSDICRAVKGSGEVCGNAGLYEDVSGIWFCGVHKKTCKPVENPREHISADDLGRLHGIAAGLKTFPADYQQMLARQGWSEVSIVFEHEGLKLKGRLDRFAEGKRPLVLDFKKCQVGKADTESCRKAILNYSYHIQASIYVNGIERLKGVRPLFAWIFVEDRPPFQPNLIFASEDDLTIGWEETLRSIRMWRDQPTAGYITEHTETRVGGLPSWKIQQWQDGRTGRE